MAALSRATRGAMRSALSLRGPYVVAALSLKGADLRGKGTLPSQALSEGNL